MLRCRQLSFLKRLASPAFASCFVWWRTTRDKPYHTKCDNFGTANLRQQAKQPCEENATTLHLGTRTPYSTTKSKGTYFTSTVYSIFFPSNIHMHREHPLYCTVRFVLLCFLVSFLSFFSKKNFFIFSSIFPSCAAI